MNYEVQHHVKNCVAIFAIARSKKAMAKTKRHNDYCEYYKTVQFLEKTRKHSLDNLKKRPKIIKISKRFSHQNQILPMPDYKD